MPGENIVYRQHIESATQSVGQIAGVTHRPWRAIARRHRYTANGARTQSIDRQGTGNGRVDPTGEPYDRLPESVLVHIVTQSNHERRVHRLIPRKPLVYHGRCGCRLSNFETGGVDRNVDYKTLLLELPRSKRELTKRIEHHGFAIEDQLVLSADHVQIYNGQSRAFGCCRQQSSALNPFSDVIWRSIDVQQDRSTCRRLLKRRTV